VRLTTAVNDEIRDMTGAEADAVWAAIERIGRAEGEPVDLPGAPPGTQYLALTPSGGKGPVVIYRPMLPGEDGDWLVASLIAREQYDAWRALVRAAVEQPRARRDVPTWKK
jgi:hypothetical protein